MLIDYVNLNSDHVMCTALWLICKIILQKMYIQHAIVKHCDIINNYIFVNGRTNEL
jgi:hypothetical protein